MPLTNATTNMLMRGFVIQRWNDRIRPLPLVEIDRFALTMISSFIIGNILESNTESRLDWDFIIYGSIYDLFRKLRFYDMKSTVQRRIKDSFPDEWTNMNDKLLYELKYLVPNHLYQKLRSYRAFVTSEHGNLPWDKLITSSDLGYSFAVLRAAQRLSTYYEFKTVIHTYNKDQKVLNDLLGALSTFEFLPGIGGTTSLTEENSKLYSFMKSIHSLRFQLRWSQAFKLPAASVLGHVGLVSVLSYFLYHELLDQGLASIVSDGNWIATNTFYAALFHDLPEVMTRDIVSPVKEELTSSVPSGDPLRTIEIDMLGELFDKLEYKNVKLNNIIDLLFYYSTGLWKQSTGSAANTASEFATRYVAGGNVAVLCVPSGHIDNNSCIGNEKQLFSHNKKNEYPVLGRLIKAVDLIAAYLEAAQSIRSGITDEELRKAYSLLPTKLAKYDSQWLTYFDISIAASIRSILER